MIWLICWLYWTVILSSSLRFRNITIEEMVSRNIYNEQCHGFVSRMLQGVFMTRKKTSNPCNRRAYMALSLSYRIKHQYLLFNSRSSGSHRFFLAFSLSVSPLFSSSSAPFHSFKWHYWIRFFPPLPALAAAAFRQWIVDEIVFVWFTVWYYR